MLSILILTLAANPSPTLPAPRFVSLPTPKFAAAKHANCACTDCKCAACDGSCSPAVTESGGEWVVKFKGRTFTVSKAEPKEAAVRLAKEVAGEKAANAPSPLKGEGTPTVKGHEHKCNSCGTVWAHADNAANASHSCPNCGRTQTVQHRDVMVPAATPAPAFIPLQTLIYPTAGFGDCPNGQCPTAPTARRGLFR